MRTCTLMPICWLAAACAGSVPPPVAESEVTRRIETPTGISPWWASLFEEGATSQWLHTYQRTESEVDDEGEWHETDGEYRETDVRCAVSHVRREGGLWASTVTCTASDPNLDLAYRWPAGDWLTDGTRLYYQTTPPEEPALTDPPRVGDVGTEFEPAVNVLNGDVWCHHYSPIDGGSSTCFQRGVGPRSHSRESSPSCCTTSESLVRK